MRTVTFSIDIPEELEARIREAGPVQWGQTGAKSDAEHLAEFKTTLSETRKHFATEGDAELHGVYLDATNFVLCHTGVSPNSPLHARILTGLWNALHAEIEKA
jgi:hypothetical protein